MWSAMIDNHRRRRSRSVFNDNNRCRSGYWCRCYYHRRRRSRSVFNDNNRCRSGCWCRCYYHRRRLYRSRHRAIGIRRPRRWYRAHAASTPNPGSVIPVPVLITGYPNALPPAIVIFRNHHRLHHHRFWRRRRLNYYSRGRSYNISLLWRKKYVIKIAEKSVNPTGIFSVINMSSGDMGVITGTSGKKASCQCYR